MNLNVVEAAISTTKFILFVFPVVLFASFATSLLFKIGIMEKIAVNLKSALKKLDLSEVAIVSIAVCFVNATAAYSILSQALRDNVIDEKEVIAVSFINSFPSMLTHLYRFFIPFVIPILGWVGLLYAALRLAVAIVKSLIGLVLVRMWGGKGNIRIDSQLEVRLLSVLSVLKSTLPIMITTYFFVQVALQLGVFDIASKSLYFLPLDPAVISIAAVQLVDAKASIVVCKGLLENGALSVKWAVAALMLGNVITFSTSYIKHSLPLHISLFGRLGIKIVALNGIASLILDAIIIAGVILFL